MTHITSEFHGQVAYVKFADLESRNAFSFGMAVKLLEDLQKISKMAENERIRCVVFEALGMPSRSRKICLAGGNMKDLYNHRQKPDTVKTFFRNMNLCTKLIREFPVPFIVKQDGWAIGGGAEFMLSADLRFATKDSGLEFKQLKIGLPTGFGGTDRLVSLIGLANAQKILLSSASLEAKEAHMLGLFHDLYPTKAKMDKAVDRLSEQLCEVDPQSLRAQKKMLRIAQSLGDESEASIFEKQLGNEKFAAFLEKFNTSS